MRGFKQAAKQIELIKRRESDSHRSGWGHGHRHLYRHPESLTEATAQCRNISSVIVNYTRLWLRTTWSPPERLDLAHRQTFLYGAVC